jgi:CheY-like chemotaxis protein
MSYRDQRGSARQTPVATATGILIVDDDRSASVSLTFMLAARGYDEVRAVRSAARALAVAERLRPGIVFLDIDVPDGRGLALADSLRRGAKQRAMRFIALTRSNEHPSRDDARAAGFERYLVKPLARDELDKVLRLPS